MPPADSFLRLLDVGVEADVDVDVGDEDAVAVDAGVDGVNAAWLGLWVPACRFCWEVVESEDHRFWYAKVEGGDVEDDNEEMEGNRSYFERASRLEERNKGDSRGLRSANVEGREVLAACKELHVSTSLKIIV